MEEDNSMAERILNDIQNIIYTDINLREFSIVPINENKNKSPVLYEQHNLGLESWCVKYVYKYIHSELFQVRHLLKRNRLPQHKIQKLNKLLIGALLIHPDVSTFWNMRRELIEYGEINLDKELLITELVLSHKSKSNEAFTYRKWILNKLIKKLSNAEVHVVTFLLFKELTVTEIAAENSQNNYHAWNHRIWCIQNVALKKPLIVSPHYLNLILNEIAFSYKWINRHVSEHTGYHYRQHLCNCILNNTVRSELREINYHSYVEPVLGFKCSSYNNTNNNILYLNTLLGKRENVIDINCSEELLKCYNYVLYMSVLLSDLFYYIKRLNDFFPGHEALWYHRRFVVYHLLKIAYEYHQLTWKRNIKLNEFYEMSLHGLNITSATGSDTKNNFLLQDSGEKCPKLLKYELDKVESSYLYKIIIETETKFIRENNCDHCNYIQRGLAIRHEKWLRFILCLCKM